jgi:hypothetical protein
LLSAATAVLWMCAFLCSGRVTVAETSRPDVEVSVDALLLWRNSLPARPLYFESTNPASVPLDTAGIGTGMAAGPRFRIDWNCFDDGGLEFNYFNVDSIGGSSSAQSPGGALEQADIFGFRFPDVTSASAAASSGIQSFELNHRHRLPGREGAFLCGFRWVEWNDGLQIRDTTLSGLTTGTDYFSANTTDSLYGAQIGLDLVLLGSRTDRAWIEGIGKTGIYYNRAVQHSFADSVSTDQIVRSTAAAADLTSFFGELGFTGCVRLSDHWVARTGVAMFWLGNVTAAGDQLSVNNLYSDTTVAGIDTGASVFLYGVNLGLEASW